MRIRLTDDQVDALLATLENAEATAAKLAESFGGDNEPAKRRLLKRAKHLGEIERMIRSKL